MNTCMDYISWYTTNISESSNGIPAILGGSSAAMIDEMIDDAMFGWSMADVWLMQWSRSPVSQKRFGRKVLPPIASTRLSLDQIRANGIIPQVCWSHLHIQQFCFYPPTCAAHPVSLLILHPRKIQALSVVPKLQPRYVLHRKAV